MMGMDSKQTIRKGVTWFRNALFIIVIGISLAACSTMRLKLYDPLTYGMSKTTQTDVKEVKLVTTEKIRVVIKKAKDLRPAILSKNLRPGVTRIGGFINVFGQVVHSFELEKDVVFLDLFTNNLISCFELAGYEVIPFEEFEVSSTVDKEKAKVLIESEILTFWVAVTPGISYIPDAPSGVAFTVILYELETRREIWSEVFMAKSQAYSLKASVRYEKSINLAYAEAIRDLYKVISDGVMRNLLQK